MYPLVKISVLLTLPVTIVNYSPYNVATLFSHLIGPWRRKRTYCPLNPKTKFCLEKISVPFRMSVVPGDFDAPQDNSAGTLIMHKKYLG